MIAYRSTLPKRTAPVTKADFENLPRPIQIRSVLNGAIQEGGPVIDFWNRHVPYHPYDIDELFMGELDSCYRLGIRQDRNSLEFHGINPRFQHDFSFRLMVEFHDNAKLIRGSDINVTVSKQGQGIGKKIFKAFNECALALGFESFEFLAMLENGAYTWAKLGVKLDTSPDPFFSSAQLSDLIRKRFLSVQQVLASMNQSLNSYDINAVKIFSSLANPFDVRDLARLPVNIPVPFVMREINQNKFLFEDAFKTADGRISNTALDAFEDQGAKLKSVFRRAHDKGLEVIPIGRVLLGGLGYPAIIDFSDQKQMEDIGKQSGGWRTIMPVRELVAA
jgi:hypothetical protein